MVEGSGPTELKKKSAESEEEKWSIRVEERPRTGAFLFSTATSLIVTALAALTGVAALFDQRTFPALFFDPRLRIILINLFILIAIAIGLAFLFQTWRHAYVSQERRKRVLVEKLRETDRQFFEEVEAIIENAAKLKHSQWPASKKT